MRQYTNSRIKHDILSVLKEDDILLIVPPFTVTSSPAFGPHILQSLARKKGLSANILYLNILLASIIGVEVAESISVSKLWTFWRMLGERLFARSAYNLPKLGRSAELCADEAMSIRGNRQYIEMFHESENFDLDQYWKIEETCTSFVDDVILSISSLNYKMIGCTVRMGQTNCSIAILHGIKQIRPDIVSLIGGINCEGEMAEGIASLTESIDYIFSGESEVSFGNFLNKYLNGELPSSRIIVGEPLKDLDSLPLPDYENFVHQRQTFLGNESHEKWNIPYETSRGCWWGEKHKCTFCGQHKRRITFRQKKVTKVLNDLDKITERYSNINVLMTDSLMPLSCYKELLPVFKEKKAYPTISYMQKANLTLKDLINLKNAKMMHITSGIESLSNGLLKLMNKGVTCKENLLLLRNAYTVEIFLEWFLLWGFPEDKAMYYEEMLQILPLIRHLQPPVVFSHIYLERFSSYFENPLYHQIHNIRPWAVYEMIYPEWADINKLAYYFTGDYPCEAHENPDLIQKIADEVKLWRNFWKKTQLVMTPFEDYYFIYDNRNIHPKSRTHIVNFDEAKEIMTSCVYKETECLKWAVEEKLGVIIDSWYVPFVTASSELLLAFEEDHGR